MRINILKFARKIASLRYVSHKFLTPPLLVCLLLALGLGLTMPGRSATNATLKEGRHSGTSDVSGESSVKAAVNSAATSESNEAEPADDRPACPPAVDSPACSTTRRPKPEEPRPVKSLVFNQTAFTLRAAADAKGVLKVRASTGEPISMPGTDNRGPIFVTYSGTDSRQKRTEWTVDLSVDSDARPGTYTTIVGAGTDDTDFEGHITIKIPEEPTFYISARMQQDDLYNNIVIDIKRDPGFIEKLTTQVRGVTPGILMDCSFFESQNEGNRLIYNCSPGFNPEQLAVTSGTWLRAGITVTGSQQTRNTSISWQWY